MAVIVLVGSNVLFANHVGIARPVRDVLAIDSTSGEIHTRILCRISAEQKLAGIQWGGIVIPAFDAGSLWC